MKKFLQKQRLIALFSAITIIVLMFPGMLQAQSITAPNVTRCGEGDVTLTVTGSTGCSGGAFNWYDQPFYGVSIGTGTTYTAVGLQESKTFYVDYVVSGVGICSRQPVTATISANSIQASIFYSSATFCKSVATPQTVTRTGSAGGAFSAAAGLTLNPSTGSITPSSSTNGTYTVTYHIETPADGCIENDATTVVTITTTPVTPEISYSGSPFCTSSGAVTVSRTGASGGTYSSSPSGLNINSSNGTITPNGSLTGEYTITYFVSGSGGCNAQSTTTTVRILQLPTAGISYTSATYTQNQGAQTVRLTGTGVFTGGAYSYKNSLEAQSGLTFDANGTITPSSSTAGTYTVSYTLAAVSPCGAPAVATTTVTIYPLPTAAIASNQTVCRNSTAPDVTFTGSGGTAPYTFTYHIGEGSDQTVTTPSGSSVNVSQPTLVTGVYLYTLSNVSDAHGSSQAQTGTATITVSAIPVATFTYAGSPYCSNGSNPTPTMLEGGVKGTFSVPEADAAKLIFASSSTGEINLAESTAGTYTVTNTIAAAGGCDIITATASVTITKLPVATFSYVGSPYCSNAGNQTATLASGAVAGIFTSTPGLVFLNTATGEVDLANSIAGTYEVTNTVAEASGCGEVHAHSSIQIDNATTVEATYFDYGTIFTRCQAEGSVTFHASAVNATSIIYTLDATTTAGGNSINAATGEVTFAEDWVGTGSVVTATSTAHCGNTTHEHITINTNAVVTVGATTFTSGETSTRCQAAGDVSYAASATNSNSITYELDAASVAAGNSIGQFDGLVTYVAGWYGTSTISASATINCGNTTTASHTVTVYPLLSISSQPAATTTICQGGSASLSVVAANGTGTYSYQWYCDYDGGMTVTNGAQVGAPSGAFYSGATTPNLTVSGITGDWGSGIGYRCIVTSSGSGCSPVTSEWAKVVLVYNPTWSTINAPTPTTLCVGGTVAFSASISGGAGGTISWIRSNNLTPGEGTEVTVTTGETPPVGTWYYRPHYAPTGNNCTLADGDVTTVTVVADPTISVQPAGYTSICIGGTTSLSVTAANGTGDYTYQWQFSTENPFDGGGFINVVNSTPTGVTYSGGNTATLTVEFGAGSVPGDRYYRCVVSSTGAGCTPVASSVNNGRLHVALVPSWNSYSFSPTTLCLGSSVSFSTSLLHANDDEGGTIDWIRSATSGGAGTTVSTTAGHLTASGTDTPPSAGTWYYRPVYTGGAIGCGIAAGTETTVTVITAPTGDASQSFCSGGE